MSEILRPINLRGVIINGGLAVKLSWNREGSVPPVHYRIYRAGKSQEWEVVGTTLALTTTVPIDTDADNFTYIFRVESVETDGRIGVAVLDEEFTFTRSAPKEVKVTLDKSGVNGVVEGTVKVKASAYSSRYTGDLEFCIRSNINNQGWRTETTWDTTGEFTMDLTPYRGQNIQFMAVARNNFDETDVSDLSSLVSIKSNQLPSAPTNVKSNVVNTVDNFKLSWIFSIDPDGQSVNYSIYERDSNGISTLITSTSNNSATISMATKQAGSTYDYYVIAHDSLDMPSQSSNIVSVTKISAPESSTNIRPTSKYNNSMVTFTWNNASSMNVEHHLYISKNGGEYVLIGTTANLSYKWIVTSTDPGETSYQLKIVTRSENGDEAIAYGTIFYKPTAPSEPVSTTSTTGYHESTFAISWTHSNWYNQSGYYNIDMYVDGVKSTSAAVYHTGNTYSFDITSIERGKVLTFSIKAVNSFNQESMSVFVDGQNRRNRIPVKPTIIGPINNSIVHSKTPRIIIYHPGDLDDQNITIAVSYNGKYYDNFSNTSYFSRERFKGENYVIFKHTEELAPGINNIIVKANDGLVDSTSETISFTVEPVNQIAAGTTIKSDSINIIINALDSIRRSYKIVPYNLSLTKANETMITAELLISIIGSINSIINEVDSYHLNSKFKMTPVSSSGIVPGGLIRLEHYNNIVDRILYL